MTRVWTAVKRHSGYCLVAQGDGTLHQLHERLEGDDLFWCGGVHFSLRPRLPNKKFRFVSRDGKLRIGLFQPPP